MEIGLSQTMAQKQILSPQMIQSMEILVLNSQQLEERLDQELEENVALELVEDEGEDRSQDRSVESTNGVDPPEIGQEELDALDREIDLLRDRYEHLAEFQAFDRANSAGGRRFYGGEEDDKLDALQNTASRPQSLQAYLEEQLTLRSALTREAESFDLAEFPELENLTEVRIDSSEIREERYRYLCRELIYNLDEQGRLRYSPQEILSTLNKRAAARVADSEWDDYKLDPPATLFEFYRALKVIQQLDPAGVGAIGSGQEGIKHCLLLQLERDPGEYPLEETLIRSHLDDIAKNRLPHIAKATGYSIEDIKEAIDIIRSLDPLPGSEFETEQNSYVRPDVLIEEVDGNYQVVVEESNTPKLQISPYYRELLEKSKKDPEIRKYIKSKIDNAEWLLHAIQQRKSTLQRVAEEVVEHQQEYFQRGVRGLKPLKMQEIADIVGVNVSTVSRAIAGKYFQAPGVIKELKYLFTGGTVKDDGSAESRDAVILRIKDLIGDEDSRRPLSDAKIVDLLAQDGIHISRRTVTKYREAEGIPSSRERRQF